MIIGITGCIGSGKSFILNKIHNIYGYDVFSCDDFTMQAYNDKDIIKQLDDKFNCLIDGSINKNAIKSQLNDDTIIILNNIIHPFVINKIIEVKEKYKNDIAFIEVPLLFECSLQHLFDFIVSISVDEKLRLKRLKNRDLLNYENMKELSKYHYSNEKKAKLADMVIYSSEDEKETLKSIDDVINKVRK